MRARGHADVKATCEIGEAENIGVCRDGELIEPLVLLAGCEGVVPDILLAGYDDSFRAFLDRLGFEVLAA